ncbi:MAG: hypothetical protein ACFFG0_33705, partial [Candidatus Thorarchaeota archaeon]
MLKTEQPSNIKPDSWYDEYLRVYDHIIYADNPELIQNNEPSLRQRIEALKNRDNKIIILNKIHQDIEPISQERDKIEKRISEKRHDPIYYNSEEYGNDKEKMAKLHDEFWFVVPPGFSEDDFESYHFLITKRIRNSDLIFNCNSLEKNKGLIEILKYRINRLKNLPDFHKIDSYKLMGWERCVLFSIAEINLCENAINQGYLTTGQLEIILNEIEDYEYDLICERKRTPSKGPTDLDFRDFSCSKSQIFDLIKKNESWHDVERDITIYQERNKGRYLHELAEDFGIKFNSISMVVNKVRGAVNYWKGKLFEDFVHKRLNQTRLFDQVIMDGGKGEVDLLAYTKDDQALYIYSLKNIKINRNPYWLTKEELRPELERAKLQSLDYKVYLI